MRTRVHLEEGTPMALAKVPEKQGRILIVDDSATNLRLLSDILSASGYEVSLAHDGAAAMRFVQTQLPELILLDVVMPNLDGFKVCQFLKSNEKTCAVPVVFMTSLVETSDKIRAFRMGAADYITKPFQAEEVLARVETLLSLHTIRKKLEARNAELLRSNDELAIVNAALGREVVEHRKVKEALQESEERMRTLINAMPDIVAFKDGEGRWLEANEFDLRLFKLESVYYRGKKDSELAAFSSFYREAFLACEESDEIAWQARKPSRADETIPCPDGHTKVFDIIKVPMFHSDGRRKGLVVVGRDITERKLAESALKKYQESLEFLVKERTAELAQANASLQTEVIERKRAEEKVLVSLREKEILLKEVHHRVKNNLQIISSLLELQSGYIHDEQSLRFFRESQDRIKTMALVHERLYASADLASIDVCEYLKNLTSQLVLSYVVDPGYIDLEFDIGEFCLGIEEAIPCGLIVNELVSNSLKYAFSGKPGGKIAVTCRADAEDMVVLSVSDNGVGIPEELDITSSETLGLQIVFLLTRQLRGTVNVRNDGGTSFAIRFPSKLSR
jgi:PAS domain S-box-containing protein